MVCHIDKETGGLVVLIPKCVRCKRSLKRDEIRTTGHSDLTMMSAPVIIKEAFFKCPRGCVKFQVGRIDLREIAKYPIDKVVFDTSTDVDPDQFPKVRV